MAPESGEQTSTPTRRTSSRPRQTPTSQRKPKAAPPIRAGSRPLLSRKKTKKQTKKPKPKLKNQDLDDDLYRVKALLDEKREYGKTFYLVDWEDTPDGTSHVPTWEPKENVTRPAIEEWEEKKEEEEEKKKKKKRKGEGESEGESEGERVRKRRRLAAISPDPSQPESSAAPTPTAPVEIPDSYEQEPNPDSTTAPQVEVVIPQPAVDFDREAYLKAASSQLSSSQPFLETAPVQQRFSTQISDLVIPDSQDVPGSSSYKTSETLPSQPTSSHFQDTEAEASQEETEDPEEPQQFVSGSATSSERSFEDRGVFITPSPRSSIVPSDPRVETSSPEPEAQEERAQDSQRSIVTTPVFQTQVPLSSVDSIQQESQAISTDHVSISTELSGINRPVRGRHSSVPVQETAPRSQVSIVRQSQSQPRELSSFDGTWQAAQARSPLPRPSTQISTQEQDSHPVAGEQPDLPHLSPQAESNDHSEEASAAIPSREDTGEIPAAVVEHVIQSIEPVPLQTFPTSETSPASYNSDLPFGLSSPIRGNMDGQAPTSEPKLSVQEKMKRARQKALEAAMQARRTASYSDAEIPAKIPQHNGHSSQVSLREPAFPTVEADEPGSPVKPHETESDENQAQIPPLGKKEYIVPLPMVGWVRDIYKNYVNSLSHEMKSFLKNTDADREDMLNKADKMVNNLKRLSDHPSLVEEPTSTQAIETIKEQAGFAVTCSTKCMFLQELLVALQRMRGSGVQVAVLARAGPMLDIIEALCKHNGIVYNRPDRDTFLEVLPGGVIPEASLRVDLLPAEDYLRYGPIERLEAVIAFDTDFTLEQAHRLQGDRGMAAIYRDYLNVISLKVVNSAEHLELCIPKNVGELERQTMLVRCIKSTCDQVGFPDPAKYPDDLTGSAESVASFIHGQPQAKWPLLPMPFVEGIEDHLTLSLPLSGSATPVMTPQPGFKRPSDSKDNTDGDLSKRQRLTPNPEVRELPTGSPQVSDMMGDLFQADTTISSEAHDLIAKTNALDTEQAAQMETLLAKISKLELQLESRVTAENQLRQRNHDLEARLRDQENVINENIQPKYQEALNERGLFEHERNEAVKQAATFSKRLEARAAEIAKLNEDKTSLDAELTLARAALSSSATPGVAEMSKLREEVHELQATNEKLRKKVGMLENQVEYMRDSYQQASNTATEQSETISRLEKEIEELERKASDNLVKIHKINQSSETAQLLQKISELETVLREREKDLERKTEELRIRMNGRRETRGTSTPMSPRMGNGTMSPRPMERIIGATRSRGSSPAPGNAVLPHDGGSFIRGDALMQSGPNIGRWGHHLQ